MEPEISVRDLKRLRALLQSTLTFFQAEDIARAQRAMTDIRPAPIAVETEEMHDRVTNILAQHVLDQEDAQEEAEAAPEEPEEEPEPIEHTSTMLAGPDLSKTKDNIAERQAAIAQATAAREAEQEAETSD